MANTQAAIAMVEAHPNRRTHPCTVNWPMTFVSDVMRLWPRPLFHLVQQKPPKQSFDHWCHSAFQPFPGAVSICFELAGMERQALMQIKAGV
jgi:hypothetical protein